MSYGIARGMYREQVFFICPFTSVPRRSKSYTAMLLPEGVNYAQYLKLPRLKSSAKSMAIPIDFSDKHLIRLSPPIETDGAFKFIDETSRFEPFGSQVLPPTEEDMEPCQGSRGSVHVLSHDGRPLASDLEPEGMDLDGNPQLVNINDPSSTVDGKPLDRDITDRVNVEGSLDDTGQQGQQPIEVEKDPVLARKRKPPDRANTRQNTKKSSTQKDKVTIESDSVPKKTVTPKSIVIDGLEFEKFGIECEINDELEDLADAD